MTGPEYVAAVLNAYLALPDTTCHPRMADRALAHQLFADEVPLPVVRTALLLAHVRRHTHPNTPPQPVRSLHYFLPLIRELSATDPDVLLLLCDSLTRRINLHQPPTSIPPTPSLTS